jgi:hypothetical protein
MRCSEVRRSYRKPRSIKPDDGKLSEDALKPASNEGCDVFHEHVPRSTVANHSEHFGPKTALRAIEAKPRARE